jgi:hypothetical protein
LCFILDVAIQTFLSPLICACGLAAMAGEDAEVKKKLA